MISKAFFDVSVFHPTISTNQSQWRLPFTASMSSNSAKHMSSRSEKLREPHSHHWSLLRRNEQNWYHILQAASRTSCTEMTLVLQHHYGMASHSPELRPPAIGSPVPSGQSRQAITTHLEWPCSQPDGQRGPSWSPTLHAFLYTHSIVWQVYM